VRFSADRRGPEGGIRGQVGVGSDQRWTDDLCGPGGTATYLAAVTCAFDNLA
jgi:hypothetical protein